MYLDWPRRNGSNARGISSTHGVVLMKCLSGCGDHETGVSRQI